MKQSVAAESERQQNKTQRQSTDPLPIRQTFVDNRESTQQLRQLMAAMDNSPQAIAQRKLSEQFHNSPRMIAQRHQMAAITGEPVQKITEVEEPIQGMSESKAVQRMEDTDELVQGKFDTAQPVPARKLNNPGLPDNLKSGIEHLSGLSMDHVKVHYNSSQPVQLNAHAYAQGADIHLAPGQEQHLPHEAWHVVQQAQGRVKPTMQMAGQQVNDDQGLEREADVMGAKAVTVGMVRVRHEVGNSIKADPGGVTIQPNGVVIQRMLTDSLPQGTQIKVWDAEEQKVLVVYLNSNFTRGETEVSVVVKRADVGAKKRSGQASKQGGKATKKAKPPTKTVFSLNAYLAFPASNPDMDIESEAKGAIGGLTAEFSGDPEAKKLIESMIEKCEDEDVKEIQLTGTRLNLVLEQMRSEYQLDLNDEEGRSLFVESEDYYGEQLMNLFRDSRAEKRSDRQSNENGGSGGSDNWASDATKRAKSTLKLENESDPIASREKTTLHHKISRANLKKLPINSMGMSEKQLLNWLPNIELGPHVDDLEEGVNPGSRFDGNYPEGIATPRTYRLRQIDDMIVSGRLDADKLKRLVQEVNEQHQLLGGNTTRFAKIRSEQWHQQPSGKFTRDLSNSSKNDSEFELNKKADEKKQPDMHLSHLLPPDSALGSASVQVFETLDAASNMTLAKGTLIRIKKGPPDLINRIFRLNIDYNTKNSNKHLSENDFEEVQDKYI